MLPRGRDHRHAARLGASLLVTALLAGAGPLSLTAADDRVVETDVMMSGTPEPDGKPVKIDATIMTTDPAIPKPAIILAHGFGGTKADSAPTARTLARDGYAVIIYTARGFGASSGHIHLDNPAYEGADVTKLIDLAASRREVAKNGNDPVIGVAGGSYGGAISLLAAGLDRRVDAIVPAFTWNSLSQALFPQYHVQGTDLSPADVTPVATQGVFKQRWASLLFLGAGGSSAPGNGSSATGVCGRFTAELCSAYLATAETGVASTALIKLLDESSPARLLSKITAPTLIIQGENDTLFPLDQADANLRGLPSSTPAAMKWVAGGHDGQIAINDYVGDLEAWFGRYLKQDGSASDTSFSVVVPAASLVGERVNREPRTLVMSSYPGRGTGFGQQRIQFSGDQQAVIAPPGGTPAALTNLPGTGGALAAASGLAGYSLGVLPGQAAIFTSQPVKDPLELVGSSRINVEITSSASSASLFASLWDLGPDIESKSPDGGSVTRPSSAVLPQLAVAPIRLTGLQPGKPAQITVALPAVSHQVPVGHRLQLVVATTDQAYALPVRTAAYQVGLTGDRVLARPVLTAKVLGANTLNVPLPLIIVVGSLALAAVVASWAMRRRWRQADPRPDLAAVPLVVDGVVKTYRDGFRAVDGISFRAEAGQVVGLLGPNGAGKTTAMRMAVGLIRPDSGSIFVNGLPVHAGADVLGSVGAFIEGPGFLPHLTGLQNLRAYWEATGRPLADAHLEEALAIAGLGAAINRRVRGYSHGMRQRLGIAQAMLGLPPLLVLDEPTNGLDPPQIKAMRTVLADYAAAGRTVVISSHLLSEVENTCSHVVVMDKGKVILTGAVADLVASDTVTLIGLADQDQVEAARRALAARGIQAEPEGQILRVVTDLPRSEIVAGLVGDGYRVESVDGHRQLEEVFMSLVSAPAAQLEDADV